MEHHTLIRHPDTPSLGVLRIEADATPEAGGGLRLHYTISGDLTALIIPPLGEKGRRDGLWRHTCCEAFVRPAGGTAYREFNFSPSGAWQVHGFRAYRDGGPLAEADAAVWVPAIARRDEPDKFTLTATLPAQALPPGRCPHLGLSVVVEEATDAGPVLSYWALRHPAGRPDFHHTDAFALILDLAPRP